MKVSKKHNIWEIWNEWTAESVYCDFKPTKEEIAEIASKVGWWQPEQKTSHWMKFVK